MTTNQKPPARPPAKAAGSGATPSATTPPIAPDSSEASRPSPAMQYGFVAQQWLDPFDYWDVNIPARHACDLANSVMDAVAGVETVMELIAAHQDDLDGDVKVSPLNPFHLGNLNRLSIFALRKLGTDADCLREVLRKRLMENHQ